MSLGLANLDEMLSHRQYHGLDLPDLVKEALWNIDTAECRTPSAAAVEST
jgi:hypothetical protein